MFIFYQPHIQQGIHQLDEEESRHCVKVLRKRAGDQIKITDGKGSFYEAAISNANPRGCTFEILKREQHTPDSFMIHIALSPTKNLDRTEWFVEKAVEIGVHRISFLLCENSERKVLKADRLQRKAVSAMKQAQQAFLPEIGELRTFESIIPEADESYKLIAYLGDDPSQQLINAVPPADTYLLLIGPEGDFSEKEIQLAKENGFQAVSLGKSRLRTETAGIAACHALQLRQLVQPS